MDLCILIPAKDEALTLPETIYNLYQKLYPDLPFNFLIINDHSTDNSIDVLKKLSEKYTNLYYVNNKYNGGVGNAIRYGLEIWKGDLIAICMADGSDSPKDIKKAYDLIYSENYQCVFGSRFIPGSVVREYPLLKLFLNRLFNNLVKILSFNNYNDFTNIFKVYDRDAIQSIKPLDSNNFSIGLEMSLKAFQNKLHIAIIPIDWQQRKAGKSKLNLRKNFSSYLKTLYKSIKSE